MSLSCLNKEYGKCKNGIDDDVFRFICPTEGRKGLVEDHKTSFQCLLQQFKVFTFSQFQ